MNNNLFTQMIYRIVFCVISALACTLSLGFFTDTYGTSEFTVSTTFWQYYTNLSNYVCFIVGVIVCNDTVQRVKNGERFGHNKKIQTMKFCATVLIMVTFLVYCTLLGDMTKPSFWNAIGNMTYHVTVPILFILDWILFDEHKTVRILDPIRAFIMPLIYVVYILIYGAISEAVTGEEFHYPYFFLNVNDLGYGGVAVWILILLGVFALLGYLMFLYDKLVKAEDGKLRFDFTNLSL